MIIIVIVMRWVFVSAAASHMNIPWKHSQVEMNYREKAQTKRQREQNIKIIVWFSSRAGCVCNVQWNLETSWTVSLVFPHNFLLSWIAPKKKLHISCEPAAAAKKNSISFNVMVKMGREWKKHPTFFGGHAPFRRYKNGCFMCDSHPHSFCFFLFPFLTDEPDVRTHIRDLTAPLPPCYSQCTFPAFVI